MATSITTIQSTDLITNSRADINNNFDSLLVNKIETDVIDVDSTFTDASDSKIPSQLAVKQYVDAGGNPDIAAAQAGGGDFGTPSATNKFITEAKFSTLVGMGDGSDGDVTISAPTTLTRNMYYSNLVVDSTLTTAGFQIFVSGTISGTGTIDFGAANNGSTPANPVSNTAVAGGAGGTTSGSGFLKTTAGAQGGTAPDGGLTGYGQSTAAAQTPCIGSAGAVGGVGGSGQDGTPVAPTAGSASYIRKFGTLLSEALYPLTPNSSGLLIVPISQGQATGGSSGGSDDAFTGSGCAGSGGGGGASGGIVFIAANTWSGTFTIKALGGNGGNGANAYSTGVANVGGGGGGAGGNGGVSIVIYGTKTWTGSYDLTGGTGGSGGTGAGGGGNGTSGSSGATGTSYEIAVV